MSSMMIKESTPSRMTLIVGETSGVYYLKKEGKINYIGKSENVFHRISGIDHMLKKYDEVEIHWLPKEKLTIYEKEQINLHKPPLNDIECKARPAGWIMANNRFDLIGHS